MLTRNSPAYSDMTGEEQRQFHSTSAITTPRSAFSDRYVSDAELTDRRKSSSAPSARLELANPKEIMPIHKNISFKG